MDTGRLAAPSFDWEPGRRQAALRGSRDRCRRRKSDERDQAPLPLGSLRHRAAPREHARGASECSWRAYLAGHRIPSTCSYPKDDPVRVARSRRRWRAEFERRSRAPAGRSARTTTATSTRQIERNSPTSTLMGCSCTDDRALRQGRSTVWCVEAHPTSVRTSPSRTSRTPAGPRTKGLQQMRADVVRIKPKVVTIFFGWNDHWFGFGIADKDIAAMNSSLLFKAAVAGASVQLDREAPDRRVGPASSTRSAPTASPPTTSARTCARWSTSHVGERHHGRFCSPRRPPTRSGKEPRAPDRASGCAGPRRFSGAAAPGVRLDRARGRGREGRRCCAISPSRVRDAPARGRSTRASGTTASTSPKKVQRARR